MLRFVIVSSHAEFDLSAGRRVVDGRQRLAGGGFDPRVKAAQLGNSAFWRPVAAGRPRFYGVDPDL